MVEKEGITIENYINVKDKSIQLGCNIPNKFAFLPRNFEVAKKKEDLIHEGTVSTARKLMKNIALEETPLEKNEEKYPYVIEHDFTWVSPILFFTFDFLSKNPNLIESMFNVLSEYLKNMGQKIRFSIVTEDKKGNYKKIKYSGDLEGLKDIPKIIEKVNNG